MMYLITPQQHSALVEALEISSTVQNMMAALGHKNHAESALTLLRSLEPQEPCHGCDLLKRSGAVLESPRRDFQVETRLLLDMRERRGR